MSSDFIAIQPFVQTTTKTITQFRLSVQELVLFQSVTIRAELFDADNNFVNVSFVTLTGTDYTSWMNDDTYIVNYVKTSLGFT